MSSLPQRAAEIDFGSRVEGKTGWSEYQQFYTFKNHAVDEVYEAAKAGLAHAGFALVKADFSNRTVIGRHGITLHDWNVVAGIYMDEDGQDTGVKIIVEGSKDIGFSGDVTGDNWTGKIIEGMRAYIRLEDGRGKAL